MIEKQILNIFNAYLSSGNDKNSFIDLSLSIIAWKAFSTSSNSSDRNLFTLSAPPEYAFDNVMKHIDTSTHKAKVEQALMIWERDNKILKGLLKIDSSIIKNIPDDQWKGICRQWSNLFASYIKDESKPIASIIDFLEPSLQSNDQEATFLAPKEVTASIIKVLHDNSYRSFYDPYCRSGNFLSAAASEMKELELIQGVSPTRLSWKMANIQLVLSKTDAKIKVDMNFTGKGSRKEDKFDIIITNPPFGVQPGYQSPEPIGEWSTLFRHSNRIDLSIICRAFDQLSEKGKAGIIVPNVFLSGLGILKEFRKQIIRKNILEAVITLPSGIFPKTGVSTAILFFNRDRKSDKVFMVDASKAESKSGKQAYLDEELIETFINHYRKQENKSGANILVPTVEEIKNKDFDFQYASYSQNNSFSFKPQETSAKIMADCIQLERTLYETKERITKLLKK